MTSHTTPSPDWFAAWFDSPYYPLLYLHRSEQEARLAVETLVRHLQLPTGAPVLDLACGSGRHSRTLTDLGFRVTGVDLSPASIERARQLVPEAAFYVQDMRQLAFQAEFQAVFNFFTSFGYFPEPQDNVAVLAGVRNALLPGGVFLLDFFNAHRVLQHIAEQPTGEYTSPEGPLFRWQKRVEGGVIRKKIEVTDAGRTLHFEEQVRAFTLPDFHGLFSQCGLRVTETLGDYFASPYDPAESERLIVIASTD
jgi:SAM-dependent methyltransferase